MSKRSVSGRSSSSTSSSAFPERGSEFADPDEGSGGMDARAKRVRIDDSNNETDSGNGGEDEATQPEEAKPMVLVTSSGDRGAPSLPIHILRSQLIQALQYETNKDGRHEAELQRQHELLQALLAPSMALAQRLEGLQCIYEALPYICASESEIGSGASLSTRSLLPALLDLMKRETNSTLLCSLVHLLATLTVRAASFAARGRESGSGRGGSSESNPSAPPSNNNDNNLLSLTPGAGAPSLQAVNALCDLAKAQAHWVHLERQRQIARLQHKRHSFHTLAQAPATESLELGNSLSRDNPHRLASDGTPVASWCVFAESSQSVRTAVLKAFQAVHSAHALPTFAQRCALDMALSWLESGHQIERRQCLLTIAHLHPLDSLQPFSTAHSRLADEDPRVRACALESLNILFARRQELALRLKFYPSVCALLGDDNEMVRDQALRLIWSIGKDAPDSVIGATAAASGTDAVRLADDVFARFGSLVNDPSMRVRVTACSLLGKCESVSSSLLLQTFDKKLMSHQRAKGNLRSELHKKSVAKKAAIAAFAAEREAQHRAKQSAHVSKAAPAIAASEGPVPLASLSNTLAPPPGSATAAQSSRQFKKESARAPDGAATEEAAEPSAEAGLLKPTEVSLVDSGACGAFVHALEDEFFEVRQAAVESIGQLAAMTARYSSQQSADAGAVMTWLDVCAKWDDYCQSTGSEATAKPQQAGGGNAGLTAKNVFAHAAVDFLVDMVNDEIDSVRLNAIGCLKTLGGKVVLGATQLEAVLGVLKDASPIVRAAIHELLSEAFLADSSCLLMAVSELLGNLKRHWDTDHFGIWKCLASIGAHHASLAEPLIFFLLRMDLSFATSEPVIDDPAYIAVLAFICNAAAVQSTAAKGSQSDRAPIVSSAILDMLPKHTRKHCAFLHDSYGDAMFPVLPEHQVSGVSVIDPPISGDYPPVLSRTMQSEKAPDKALGDGASATLHLEPLLAQYRSAFELLGKLVATVSSPPLVCSSALSKQAQQTAVLELSACSRVFSQFATLHPSVAGDVAVADIFLQVLSAVSGGGDGDWSESSLLLLCKRPESGGDGKRRSAQPLLRARAAVRARLVQAVVDANSLTRRVQRGIQLLHLSHCLQRIAGANETSKLLIVSEGLGAVGLLFLLLGAVGDVLETPVLVLQFTSSKLASLCSLLKTVSTCLSPALGSPEVAVLRAFRTELDALLLRLEQATDASREGFQALLADLDAWTKSSVESLALRPVFLLSAMETVIQSVFLDQDAKDCRFLRIPQAAFRSLNSSTPDHPFEYNSVFPFEVVLVVELENVSDPSTVGIEVLFPDGACALHVPLMNQFQKKDGGRFVLRTWITLSQPMWSEVCSVQFTVVQHLASAHEVSFLSDLLRLQEMPSDFGHGVFRAVERLVPISRPLPLFVASKS